MVTPRLGPDQDSSRGGSEVPRSIRAGQDSNLATHGDSLGEDVQEPASSLFRAIARFEVKRCCSGIQYALARSWSSG
jgi:hypothetical protein